MRHDIYPRFGRSLIEGHASASLATRKDGREGERSRDGWRGLEGVRRDERSSERSRQVADLRISMTWPSLSVIPSIVPGCHEPR